MGMKARSTAKKKTGLKTQATKASAAQFVAGLSDERRRKDSETLLKLMREVTGKPPVMWGTSIVGYGSYDYKYSGGREGTWPRTGFSPRKQQMTIYCMPGFAKQQTLLKKLGPHKTAVSCLYIKRLEDVDLGVLRKIIHNSLDHMKQIYGE